MEFSNSLPSRRITHWLDDIAKLREYPKSIRVNNTSENIGRHFQEWAKSHREAILNSYLFKNIKQVQCLTDEWLRHSNEERL